MVSKFKVDNRWWLDLFGGGHTVLTDPTRRGWRAKRAGGPDTVLVGRPGKPGCFSAVPFGDNHIDVAIYDEAPEEVARMWKNHECVDSEYQMVSLIPGWALVFVLRFDKGDDGDDGDDWWNAYN